METTAHFFYGLSGTFKGTTIDKKRLTSEPVLWSGIKTWKSLESGIFSGQASERNDINYAMLHLCGLELLMKNMPAFKINEAWSVWIERGVSDMAYYYLKNGGHGEKFWLSGEDWIKESVQKELNLLQQGGITKIEKTLLVMTDEDFIGNVILEVSPDNTRGREFCFEVNHYLEEQNKYIEFTKKFNNIDNVINISNAKEYITGTLGLEFKNN